MLWRHVNTNYRLKYEADPHFTPLRCFFAYKKACFPLPSVRSAEAARPQLQRHKAGLTGVAHSQCQTALFLSQRKQERKKKKKAHTEKSAMLLASPFSGQWWDWRGEAWSVSRSGGTGSGPRPWESQRQTPLCATASKSHQAPFKAEGQRRTYTASLYGLYQCANEVETGEYQRVFTIQENAQKGCRISTKRLILYITRLSHQL